MPPPPQSGARFNRFFGGPVKIGFKLSTGRLYIDYKNVDELRRLVSANGKMISRQRTRMSAMDQRHSAVAVKRARQMALLPYNSELR